MHLHCRGAVKRMGMYLGSSKLRDEQYYKQLDDDKKYFLLLMLGDFQDAMIIPEEVVRRFKGEIPREIKLETRNGYSYTIVIAKNQEKLVLTVGWRQFVENYDLQIGDSLMFRYKGNSQFNVMIFDKLGREKALSVVLDPFLHWVQDRRNEAHEIGSSKKMDVPWERCKSRTEYHYANLDDEKKYFLVHMMSDFQHEMIISEEFVQRFKGEFPREIILQTQNCRIYVIGVAKNNGNLVLTVGWEKFVETFGLEIADTIVFRYNGNSQFNVIIFDELGCEKASSVFVDHFLPPVQERRTSATDTAKTSPFHPQPIQTVLPESPPTNQMEVDESCQGNRTATTIYSDSYDSLSTEYGHGVCDIPGPNYIVKKKKKKKATLSSFHKDQLKDGYITVLKARLTSAQKEVVKQKVQSMHSEIPIFVAVMSKCNIVVEFCLNFPRHYAKKYLGEEPHMYIQLLGKKWKVRFTENSGGKKLRSGWRQFVEDNKLKMGDICLLKLLTDQRRTMDAYIIRANVANYAGREVAFRRGSPAHHAGGARDPNSRLLRITKTEAMEDDDVVAA